MSNSRFWNGMVAGGVLGAMVTWLVLPQVKAKSAQQRVKGLARPIQRNARNMMHKMQSGVQDFID